MNQKAIPPPAPRVAAPPMWKSICASHAGIATASSIHAQPVAPGDAGVSVM